MDSQTIEAQNVATDLQEDHSFQKTAKGLEISWRVQAHK